jgi:hypothetical protein
MIELQRARLLGAKAGSNGGTPVSTPTQNGSSQPNRIIMPGQSPGALPPVQAHQTPQQAAAAAVRLEELHMERFFHRLQARDDSRPDASSGPTVPTALSRRILQKQGVGYLDDTVAAVVSASADRFLATILHQAAACRDQRLKGAELAREASRHRTRHIQHYQVDADDRQRRKEEKEKKREKASLAAVEAAEALRRSGKTPAKEGEPTAPKSKKKKKVVEDIPTNGRKPPPKPEEDDDDSYDSVDEEEDYYRNYYSDNMNGVKDDDDEDDDEVLILRDIARPLEAWDFHLTGKEGMYHRPEDSDDEADLSDDEDDDDDDNDNEDFRLEISQGTGEKETSTQQAAKSPAAEKGDKKPSGDDKPPKGPSAPTTSAAS